ncbi:MAG: hypothetical protein HYU64_15955 [Armatimonadetes bacterium]|nr:hypothetical protein [Armatimonadota bacterium]
MKHIQYSDGRKDWKFAFKFPFGDTIGQAEWHRYGRLKINGSWFGGLVDGDFAREQERATIELRPFIEALYGKTYTLADQTLPRVHFDRKSRSVYIRVR